MDDRTGFPQRAERTRRQWDNLIVDEAVWEPRQPQDLVRGVQDIQWVADPRPLAPDSFVGPTWTTTTADAAVGAMTLQLASVAGFAVGDTVSVMMDSGVLIDALVTAVGASSINIDHALITAASEGAQVWNYGVT